MSEAMEVDPPAPPKAGESAPPAATPQQDSEEEDVSDLVELLESADEDAGLAPEARIPVLASILADPAGRTGPKATSVKERAVYGLARAYCGAGRDKDVVGLLTGDVCRPFFDSVTKAKCAKVVRAVLDIVCALAPEQLEMVSAFVAAGAVVFFSASRPALRPACRQCSAATCRYMYVDL